VAVIVAYCNLMHCCNAFLNSFILMGYAGLLSDRASEIRETVVIRPNKNGKTVVHVTPQGQGHAKCGLPGQNCS